MQLSDYVIDVVAQEGVKIVFMVSGGGGNNVGSNVERISVALSGSPSR